MMNMVNKLDNLQDDLVIIYEHVEDLRQSQLQNVETEIDSICDELDAIQEQINELKEKIEEQ